MILDLLKSHGITPQKKAGTHGGEYASPCPACGGRDRFMVWPDQGEHGTWWCRGCDKGGDAIEFLRAFDGLSFAEACARLGVKRQYQRQPLTLPKPTAAAAASFIPKEHQPPPPIWQEKAAKLLDYAHKELLANSEELAKLAARGLPLGAVERFRLGWLPGERVKKTGEIRDCYYRVRSSWGLPDKGTGNREQATGSGKPKKLWIPRGLVVPALGPAGQVLRLRVRRLDADRERFSHAMKYVVIPGSYMGPLCLLPSGGACGNTAHAFVVVESELDAMACLWAADQAGLAVGALAVGTNLGKPDAAAHSLLTASAAILVALDFDEPDKNGKRPGAQGVAWWRGQYRQAERWPTTVGKDIGEGVALGMDVAAWLRAGLPPVMAEDRRRKTEDRGQKAEATEKLEAGPVAPDLPAATVTGEEMAPPVTLARDTAKTQPSKGGGDAVLVVTMTSGSEFHLTDDREAWNALVARGEVVFSRHELARLHEAISDSDEAARLAALEKVLAVKRAFTGAYIRDGRAGRHRRACGMATKYFLCPPTVEEANA